MRSLILFALTTQLPSCIHRKDLAKETVHINTKETTCAVTEAEVHTTTPPPITIWVHGTVIFYKSTHKKTFNNQSKLFLAQDLSSTHRFYHIAQAISHNDPTHFPFEQFYIFVWSGKLSAKERKNAADVLYIELSTLIGLYETKYHCKPTIRIIAHSHGGNVVLHMANIDSADPITIKSLILLACPVQDKTMHLVNMPMFNHIYSLYSSIDMIQIIAPQIKQRHLPRPISRNGYRMPAFSSRLFPPAPLLIQTKIKLNGYPITHTHFSRADFLSILPTILEKLDTWDSYLQREKLLYKQKLLCVYS